MLNADDPLVAAMAARTAASVVTFGRTGADLVLGDVEVDDLGRASFDLGHDGTEHVALRLVGEHQAMNAAATAATALAAGLSLAEVAESLRSIDRLSPWRMEVHERPDGLVVVNDAYNANPDSMVSALETLAWMGRRGGRRTIAVLGEMRELGASAEDEHRAIGALAHRLGIDEVVVVGEGARAIHEAVRRRAGRRRHDAPPRHRRTGRRVVARQCGGSRRRPGQGVPGPAARTGRRDAARGGSRSRSGRGGGPMTTPRNRVWSSLRSPATRFRGDPG